MKKGEIYQGVVTEIKYPNKGLVQIEGEDTPCIVKNVVPGQRLSLRVSKKRKGKAEGTLLEIVEKAPNEVTPACPHFGACGGCTYQMLSYEDQLALKAGQVKKLLDEVYINRGEAPDYLFEAPKRSPREMAYRNKMEFSFGDYYKDGPLSLGLHKKGSFYDIVAVTGCQIVDEDYRQILAASLDFFTEAGVSFYHRMAKRGYLRHLLVRKAAKTGEILVALVTTEDYMPFGDVRKQKTVPEASGETPERQQEAIADVSCETPECQQEATAAQLKYATEADMLTAYKDTLLALMTEGKLTGSIVGILHDVNNAIADVVKAERIDMLYGRDYFYEELMGLQFKVSQFSFFQTNSLGAEVLYETARSYVGDVAAIGCDMTDAAHAATAMGQSKTADATTHQADPGAGNPQGPVLYDLYSGTGTIAQMMAPVCHKVIGVEIVEEAVAAAGMNAEKNGLKNCEFIAGDVLKVLDDIKEKPDYIILDPPRDGIHPKALQKIIAYGMEQILYISCKPTSLARDLGVFLEEGYRMEKAVCVDMFPFTTGIETVALLIKSHVAM